MNEDSAMERGADAGGDGRGIVIATVGRFHYASLADGLHRMGRLERFYSGLPRSRLRCPTIPRERIRTDPWFMIPYMLSARYPVTPTAVRHYLARRAQESLDRTIARSLPDCAAYVAMSGCGLISGAAAQRRGIRYCCERGAAHIRHNAELLRAEVERWGVSAVPTDPRMIEREEAEYRLADRLLVLSESNARTFIERGVPADKIRVVPPTVQPTGTPGPVDRGPGFRVLFVGGMNLWKGIGYLMRAFRKAAIPGAELVMVGNPFPETRRLMRHADPERTRYLGPLPHHRVLEEMRRAHVLVLPSITEGTPLVIFEALACGLPVIANEAYGGDEIITRGRNGLVTAARDEEALAAALVRLHEERDLLRGMAEAAAADAARVTSADDYAERWLAAVEH